MTINDLSPLIQLSATMSIAFVAVEYVKSYTSILCERFFRFQDFVEQSFKECLDILLPNKDTLKHIRPVDIEGKSTNTAIEEAKRQHESLIKKIEDTKGHKKEEVVASCQARSMSSLCFFIFLFSTSLLFIGGIEDTAPRFTHIYSLIFCVLIYVYVVIGWCIGEVEKPKRFCDFSSLRHSTWGFLIITSFSFIFACLIINNCFSINIDSYWRYILIGFGSVLPYINFIIFVFKIRKKAATFKEDVKAAKDKLKDECKKVQEDVEDLLATYRVSAKLKAD